MKISEAIKQLQAIHDECGDIEVVTIDDDGEVPGFGITYGKVFDVAFISESEDDPVAEVPICAFMDPLPDYPNGFTNGPTIVPRTKERR